MYEFRFTFGVRYASEPHPNCPWVTPKGWLTVIAPSYEVARRIAEAIVGRESGPDSPVAYAFGYSEMEWAAPSAASSGRATWDEIYTDGCLLKVTVEEGSGA